MFSIFQYFGPCGGVNLLGLYFELDAGCCLVDDSHIKNEGLSDLLIVLGRILVTAWML